MGPWVGGSQDSMRNALLLYMLHIPPFSEGGCTLQLALARHLCRVALAFCKRALWKLTWLSVWRLG